MLDPNDTIAALASAPGGAARGIVRVSGLGTLACVEACFVPDGGQPLSAVRRPTALSGVFALPSLTASLPGVLYLWPSSRSYTRQPTAELHTLGSPPLLEALLSHLCLHGARPAQPGEFTLRAFLAGRIDLTQAEAVLGVIDARGRQELDVALAQLAGGLAAPLARLRGDLLDLLAHLEAGLDFTEEDIEFISRHELQRHVSAALAAAERLATQMQARGEGASAVRAVLVGAPNVGKSSLFNALTGQKALVSDRAGTTRDYLTARLDLDGVICELVDTAGLAGATADHIETAAQEATRQQQRQAEIELLCLDATRELTSEEEASVREPARRERVVVFTKADRPCRAPMITGAIETSSRTGAGLDRLRARLRGLAQASNSETSVVAATALRCRESLRQATDALSRVQLLVESAGGEELIVAELRDVLSHLGEVAGVVYTDDILDRVFSRFCIGK
ncbi:MAG TPA: tRNA modification GTPase [Pirellulales bacterium]|nr:tRNA modification GTPase [Pirellulales bacterium]